MVRDRFLQNKMVGSLEKTSTTQGLAAYIREVLQDESIEDSSCRLFPVRILSTLEVRYYLTMTNSAYRLTFIL